MVLTAFVALGSLLMVALVADLGQLRVDRRTNKGVADVAARAGIARLAFGPWSGVCKAREFLLGNAKGFSSFDAGSETWSNAAALARPTNPCPAVVSAPDVVPCAPNNPSTWAKLQATAVQGRFTIEIQSGYVLPDPRFAGDAALGDTGATDQGSCDNLAVIITERQEPSFAQVGGNGPSLVRTRSVGRLNAAETLDFVAALQLLERHDCDVLVTGGSGSRVIAQSYNAYPGTIQIDSDGATCQSNSKILNGQVTPGGTIVACSADDSSNGCRLGSGSRPSRVGIYAVNFQPAASVTTPYSSSGATSYGDTMAVPSPRTGRKYIDLRYRQNVVSLDQSAKSVLTGNSGRPPGCAVVLLYACTGNGITWLVVDALNCGAATLPLFFTSVLGRASAQNIWFDCDLDVRSPLALTGSNAYIVVTGQLAVNSILTITDPRQVYVGGRANGNKIGLDLTNPTGVFNVNAGGAAVCSTRTGAGHANRLVVGKGSLKVGSGFTARMCQTFVFLASGYDKVPATDGTDPCTTSACNNYTGTFEISSGAVADFSAPNEITGRAPDVTELSTTNLFEDLGLWTEAGGATNGLAGGAASAFRGVFFLPNAAPFTLSGGGALPIDLSAQFVSTTLKVTGNSAVNLVPNPEDSIAVRIYTTLLVR